MQRYLQIQIHLVWYLCIRNKSDFMPRVSPERRNIDLTRKVERKQKQIWDKKITDEVLYDIHNRKTKSVFFTAKWYLENGILDSTMLTGLRKSKRMLSVGAGPGILEKTLLALSVPSENIDVTDIKLHPDIKRTRFRKFQFDMTKKWPDLDRKYDYILFPESFCFEKISLSEEEKESYNEYFRGKKKNVSMETTRAKLVLEIIKNAVTNLNPDGQIRMAGLFLFPPELKFVLSELERRYPNMRLKILQINEDIGNCYLILQFFDIPVRRRRPKK